MPTIVERELEIKRVQRQTFQQALDETLEATLRSQVVETVKGVLEEALVEELREDLSRLEGDKPRRSGYYTRVVDTQ